MREVSVVLNSIERVRKFVSLCEKQSFDICVSSGRHRVNAKSLMGVFSLDLSVPVTVELPEKALDFSNVLKSDNW